MTEVRALKMIFRELERARGLYPDWPRDPVHRAAIVTEGAGELLQASLNYSHHQGSPMAMTEEAIQTAAMCLRFLTERA